MKELKPSYAPVYAAALYPDLCPLFHRHGYALAVHGSLARDFDLIAVPWREDISHPDEILDEIEKEFAIRRVGSFCEKVHSRFCQTLSVGFGICSLDLSFVSLPRGSHRPQA